MATLCCVALVVVVLPARRQRQAVLELQSRGVQVRYVGESPNNPSVKPTWCQTWLRCDFGQHVDGIYVVVESKLTERDWEQIQRCQPRSLSILAQENGDHDLQQVAKLHSLKELEIINDTVTDQGVVHLKNLPQLEKLILDATVITDKGINHLTEFPNLRELDLSGARVTTTGLMKLSALPALKTLTVHRVRLKDVDQLGLAMPNCKIYTHGLTR